MKTLHLSLLALLTASIISAGDGTWIGTAATAVWSSESNWQGGQIADGAGAIAYFTNPLASARTVTLDGAVASRTLGELILENTLAGSWTIAVTGTGKLLMDNQGEPAFIQSSQAVEKSNVTINPDIIVPDNQTLLLQNNTPRSFETILTLGGNISGDGIRIENAGTGAGMVTLGNATRSFTGEIINSSLKSRLNVVATTPFETVLGDVRNPICLLPGAMLALNRGATAVLNPLRTITLEGGTTNGTSIFGNDYNHNKHYAGAVVGNGGLMMQGAYNLLSGKNSFEGGLIFDKGTTLFSSFEQLGCGNSISNNGNGTTIGILGTEVHDFGDKSVTTTTGNNGGFAVCIADPNNYFIWDTLFSTTGYNSSGAVMFNKKGAGDLIVSGVQTNFNDTGRTINAGGGNLIIDYAAGGTLPVSPSNKNRIGFSGGTLVLNGRDGTSNVVQSVGNFRIEEGGGRWIVDNRDSVGTFRFNMGNFTNSAAPVNGSALNIITKGAPESIILTTTEGNNTSGLIGNGRVLWQSADWLTSTAFEQGVNLLCPFTQYVPWATVGQDTAANIVLDNSGVLDASAAMYTLKINASQPNQSLTIADGQTLSLGSGALLFTGDNDYTLTGGRIKSELGTADADLIVHHYGAGTLTIQSELTTGNGVGTFTKIGPGTVVLETPLNIGGQTTIAEGTLSITTERDLNQASGTLTGFTSSTSSSTATCSMGALPDGFLQGSTIVGRTVRAISGIPGGYTFTLSGNATANVTGGSTTFTTSPGIYNNGTLRVRDSFTMARTMTLGDNGGAIDVADGKTFAITKSMTGGNLILNNTDPEGSGVFKVTTFESVGGGLYIKRGTYQCAGVNALNSSGINPIFFGDDIPAKFRIDGEYAMVCAGLSGSNTAAIVEGGNAKASSLAILNGWDNLFAGTIKDGGAGALSIMKAGAGTLTLTGASTYTGTTQANGGELKVDGSLVSDVTVNAGFLSGSGTVGAVTVEEGGTIATTGLTASAITIKDGGGVRVTGTANTITGNVTLGETIVIENIADLGAGRYTLFSYTGDFISSGAMVLNPQGDLTYKIRNRNNTVALTVSPPPSIINLF